MFKANAFNGFVEVGHKMSYYTLHIKSYFSKNLHVIWPGQQFKADLFFLKHQSIWNTLAKIVI